MGNGFVFYRLKAFPSVALSTDVNFKTGQILSAEFTTDHDTSYDINLELERSTDFEKLSCWLGKSSEGKDCAGADSKLSLSWELFSNGQKVGEGRTRREDGPSRWGRTIGRKVGEFLGSKGRKHRLIIFSQENFEETSVANPKIIVQVNNDYFQQFYYGGVFLQLGSLALMAFGVLFALPALFKKFKSRSLKGA